MRRRPPLLTDQFGRGWIQGKGGWRHESFLVTIVVSKRKHARPAYRHGVFEGGLELAQFDREEDAYRYVDELLESRDKIDVSKRLVWRVKYDVHKGRELAEKGCEMFVEAPTLMAAAQRATVAAEDMHGGAIFIEAIRRANWAEHQRYYKQRVSEGQ
jgi:hypothetical protein